jgi:hypothetical protein
VDIETLLSLAAAEIAKKEPKSWRCDDGTSLIFHYAPPDHIRGADISVPIEAIILRAEPNTAAALATTLAVGNGPRDGRLYTALIEFSKAPRDKSRRKYLARAASGAPFRLVADDPRFIFSFGDRAAMSQQGYPATLDELRQLLSEPNDLEDVNARTLAPRFFERFQENGAWFERADQHQLVELASRVPGPLPAVAALNIFAQQDADDLKQIERALTVSQNMPIGMLSMASAFAMLTLCSDPQSEQAPSMCAAFVDMLRRETLTTSENDTLASVEPAALQSVGRVVARFTPWGTSVVNHAWLTTRLYEWWMREVEVAEVCSFLRPDKVETSWQRLRAEVVLNIMLDIVEAIVLVERRVPNLPHSIVEVLKDVACRDTANPFEAAHRPAWIYWDRPQGCEWLASLLLLWGEPGAFADLRPELRLAMLEKLPRTKHQSDVDGISFQPVFRAVSRSAAWLTEPELNALQQWLHSAESEGLLDLWRADLLTAMFASRGDTNAAAKLRQLVAKDSFGTARVELVGGYLEAAVSPKVAGMEATVIELLGSVLRTSEGEAHLRAGVEFALGRPNRDSVLKLLHDVLRLETVPAEVRAVVEPVVASAIDVQKTDDAPACDLP